MTASKFGHATFSTGMRSKGSASPGQCRFARVWCGWLAKREARSLGWRVGQPKHLGSGLRARCATNTGHKARSGPVARRFDRQDTSL